MGLDESRPAPGLGGITMWPYALAGAFLLSLQHAPDHPAPNRVVREMLPRERFGPS